MIKVLHYGLHSKLGGIETYLHKLYKNIDKEKFSFDFLVIDDGQKPCWYDEFSNMGSHFYKVTPRSSNLFKNRKEIKKVLKSQNYDVLHAHLNTLSYITPVQEALKQDIPVILHSRNAGTPKSKVSNFLHNVNSYMLSKKNIEKLAVSGEAGNWLFGTEENFTVINNGIDVDRYKFEISSRKQIRKELGLKDEFTIVHVGALRQQKNHDFLLKVFKEFLSFNSKSKLLLVGEGALETKIKQQISELGLNSNVLMLGNRADIPKVLSASDFFLFPSFFEGFPNAVLEAQTTGLPCLISDVITKEVLINENCCMFSLEKSPKLWAKKILDIPNFKNRIEAVENIKKRGLSVDEEIEKIENIYVKLTS